MNDGLVFVTYCMVDVVDTAAALEGCTASEVVSRAMAKEGEGGSTSDEVVGGNESTIVRLSL